jgi:TonB family protein
MPPSVAKGDKGVVRVRLLIQKDGTVAASTPPTLLFSSRKTVLDDHAKNAVLKAAPFEHVPEQLSAPTIELHLTFYCNVDPLSPAERRNVGPRTTKVTTSLYR